MIEGLQQHFGDKRSSSRVRASPSDVIAKLDTYGPKLMSANAAHQAWLAESRELAQLASGELDPMLVNLHNFLVGRFGRGGGTLTDFGMTPRRPRKKTAQQRVAIAQKAAATRTARHTVGPRQKKAIRGVAKTK
jgi:hypothetical protein